MPFSHHSHSGQFCGHAKNTLEEMVQAAISRGMKMYALTEHMPREVQDFYPEEIDVHPDENSLHTLFDAFWLEACSLKERYASQIEILIGFESEWIRPSSLRLIKALQDKYPFDLFVGSVHHVHTHPNDFDRATYEKARHAAGGGDEKLFEDYFDSQYEMLQALKPPIVGHFDLIRLLSDDKDQSYQQYAGVWSRIERNLKFVAEYGGILEFNSSAVRKGMREPYPQGEVVQMFLSMSGRFCLSDDAHGVDQVGLNYGPTIVAAKSAGVTHLSYYTRSQSSDGSLQLASISIEDALGLVSKP